jgi:hypothetical protein
MPAYLCRFTTTITLLAGVTQPVDVPIDGARDSTTVLRVSAGDLDTATVSRSPLGALFDDAESLTGTPVAASGTSVRIEEDKPITTLRLVLGSTAGCVVAIESGGW